jgi:hypothetical protein
MSYRTVNVDVDVDIDDIISDIDTDDLLDELKRRGADYNTEGVDGDLNREILENIHQKRRLGKDYQDDLNTLIYNVLGKIV